MTASGWRSVLDGVARGFGASEVRAPQSWQEMLLQLAGATVVAATKAAAFKAQIDPKATTRQRPAGRTARRVPRMDWSLIDAAVTLGVRVGASEIEIQRAFREAMRKAHPDVGGDPGIARRLINARDLLRAHARRRR